MEVRLSNQLPVYPSFVSGIRRALIAAIRLRLHKQKQP